MKLFLFSVILSALIPAMVFSQNQNAPVSDFISKADLIIVAKCIDVGPVNKIGISRVAVDVINILKGESADQLTYSGRGALTPGRYYLIRFPEVNKKEKPAARDQIRETVIEIVSESEAMKLNELSVEIAVRRTLNIRMGRLESDIRALSYELDELKRLQKEN